MGVFDTIKREYTYLTGALGFLKQINNLDPEGHDLVADEFEASADKHARNIAIRFQGELITFAELDRRANQFANWGLAEGFAPGDTIALFMENKPDYIAFWLGMSKIGVITALINTNLKEAGLAHCIEIGNAKTIVADIALAEKLDSARHLLKPALKLWSHGGNIKGAKPIEPALASAQNTRPDSAIRANIKSKDVCLYVYTSGTTGLPKAARLTNLRTIGMMRAFIPACRITARDRILITLPLYHGTGGICAVGQGLLSGASIILTQHFSASGFWKTAVEERATSFVYIGELCRYLVNARVSPLDRAHSIRTGFGNGMRHDVWQDFKDRFGINHLVEFYGSTEGNVSLFNFDGTVGAIGRLPDYVKSRLKIRIVKFDVEAEKPVRGENGFCIETDVNEPGELIGEISEKARERFDGYQDPANTEKKILRDVFHKGDMWFRTGDLVKKDEHAYIYFVDRIGDTFRWKGENVSTGEVAEVLNRFDGIENANVYGIALPGAEGKAGMATINRGDYDFKALAAWLDEKLPIYARPIFLRLKAEDEATGTFKLKKVDLVEQGYSLARVEDPVFVRLPKTDSFVPLTAELEARINNRDIEF